MVVVLMKKRRGRSQVGQQAAAAGWNLEKGKLQAQPTAASH